MHCKQLQAVREATFNKVTINTRHRRQFLTFQRSPRDCASDLVGGRCHRSHPTDQADRLVAKVGDEPRTLRLGTHHFHSDTQLIEQQSADKHTVNYFNSLLPTVAISVQL